MDHILVTFDYEYYTANKPALTTSGDYKHVRIIGEAVGRDDKLIALLSEKKGSKEHVVMFDVHGKGSDTALLMLINIAPNGCADFNTIHNVLSSGFELKDKTLQISTAGGKIGTLITMLPKDRFVIDFGTIVKVYNKDGIDVNRRKENLGELNGLLNACDYSRVFLRIVKRPTSEM